MQNLNLSKVEDIVLGVVILLLVSVIAYKHWGPTVHSSGAEGGGLGIKELIGQVKGELIEADKESMAKGQVPLFLLRGFDLELNFIVKGSGKAEVGANLELLSVGAESTVESQKVQKITLHMSALEPNEAKAQQSDGNGGKSAGPKVHIKGPIPPDEAPTKAPPKPTGTPG